MASLRDRSLYHKFVKGQLHYAPGLGQVILIKDESIARGMWKLGRIEKLNKDNDGNIRTAKIYLSNGRYVQRAVNQLFPLEVPDELNKVPDEFKEVNKFQMKMVDILCNILGVLKNLKELRQEGLLLLLDKELINSSRLMF